MPKPQRWFTLGEAAAITAGGVVGAVIVESTRDKNRPVQPPPGCYGAPEALRRALSAELQKSVRFKVSRSGPADAELRIRIKECAMPALGFTFSKVSPLLSVEAVLVDRNGAIMWQDRRRIHHNMKKSPDIPRKEFAANPSLGVEAMRRVAELISAELVQSMSR
jgi:hypothetical protein